MSPVFLVSAAVAVITALSTVTQRNPIYSAVSLLVCFLSFAVLFLDLSAPFLAAIHVLVYTGAILVLFLFVIMLLNLKDEELGQEYPMAVKASIGGLCAALFALIAVPIAREPSLANPLPPAPEGFGSIETTGRLLFNDFALPFELISLLIVVAMFGALVLAKKRNPAGATEPAGTSK